MHHGQPCFRRVLDCSHFSHSFELKGEKNYLSCLAEDRFGIMLRFHMGVEKKSRKAETPRILVKGARENNLKGVVAEFPGGN